MSVGSVRKSISNLTAENFSSTLSTIEPFLLNEAGSTIYAKSMKRIGVRAKFLGVEVPADFAKEAKATSKRREKQNAFIQVKEEERYEFHPTCEFIFFLGVFHVVVTVIVHSLSKLKKCCFSLLFFVDLLLKPRLLQLQLKSRKQSQKKLPWKNVNWLQLK